MKKITLCLMIILVLIMVPRVILAAIITATTPEQFITNVEDGNAFTISKNLTVKLEKDLTITNTITIGAWSGSKATVTIDLNGHTIKFNGSSAYLYVQNAGELIVEDSVGTGLMTNAGATSGSTNLIQVKGVCEINGGTVENTLSNKQALYLQGETKIATGILNNGTIVNKYTGGGAAVSVGKGTFTMNGGKVQNKAAGSDGLVPAIKGGEIKITGGIIEAAGTGIQSSNANVNITGGTIKAGWFGLHTSNATINPAEGRTVNIIVPTPEREKDNAAIVLTYNKLKTGEGNEIYGGNFEAPEFMETGYVCYPDNMKVYGGVFTHEVPAERVAPGYVVNKVGDKYKVESNTPNIVDDDLKADDKVEMGFTTEVKEKLDEIFEKEIKENEKIQKALLDGKKVDIHVQMKKVEEEDVKEELEAVKETSKDKKIAKIYDIALVVKVDGAQIDTISETSSKLKFKVLIPEELIKEGRTFVMYRYHDGKNGGEVEEITGEIDDENYFVFESDRFSTYVLAYEDKVEQQKPEQDNTGNEGTVTPPTGDEENKDDEGTVTPPVVEEDNTGKGEAEQQPEIKPEDKPVEDTKKPTTPDVPKTGDNVILYVALAAIALFGIIKVRKVNNSKRKH